MTVFRVPSGWYQGAPRWSNDYRATLQLTGNNKTLPERYLVQLTLAIGQCADAVAEAIHRYRHRNGSYGVRRDDATTDPQKQ